MTAAGAEPDRAPGTAAPDTAPASPGIDGGSDRPAVPPPGPDLPAAWPGPQPEPHGPRPPGTHRPPAPPPGPGVAPPFAAPPADRSRRTLWISLIVAALALVLCGGGGLFGLGVIAVSSTDQLKRQAQDVVGSYLDALRNEDYPRAYGLLCAQDRARTPLDDFTAARQDAPRPASYQLGTVEIGNDIVVPARVRFDNGVTRVNRFVLVQDRRSAELRICRGTG